MCMLCILHKIEQIPGMSENPDLPGADIHR